MQSTQNAPQMTCSLCREHSANTKPFKQGVICEDCSVDLSFGGGGGGGTGSATTTTSPPLPTAGPGSPPHEVAAPSLFVAGVGPKVAPRPPRALAAPVLTTSPPSPPQTLAHPAHPPSVFYGTMMAPTPPPPPPAQFHHHYHHGQQAQHLMATAAAAHQRHTMMHRHTTTTRAHFGPRPGATMPLASGAGGPAHAPTPARVSKTPSPPPGLLPRRATPSPTSRFPTPAPAPAAAGASSSSSRDTRCDWRHRCKFGVDCMFLHSPDEMAYFREHGGVGNPVWKTKTCVNWKPHEAASCDFYHPGTDPVWCEHVGPNTGNSNNSNTGAGSGAGSGSGGSARASTSAGRTVCRTAATGSPPRTFGGAAAASQRMVRPQRVPRWPAPTSSLLGAASAAMATPYSHHSTSSSASALRGRADLKSNWRQRGSPTVATSPTVQIAA